MGVYSEGDATSRDRDGQCGAQDYLRSIAMVKVILARINSMKRYLEIIRLKPAQYQSNTSFPDL
jgi:hypothetical protein